MWSLWLKLALGVIPVACLLNGCTMDTSVPPLSGAARVGVLYPMSGSDASTGSDLKAALDLAVEIVNGEGDLPQLTGFRRGLGGRKIELVFRDTQGDPVVASKAFDELVAKENIVAAIGCYHSGVTALVSEQAEMARIPLLNAASTSPILSQRGLKWFFRTTPDDGIFSANFFEFLNALRDKPAIPHSCPLVLVYEDGLWGTSVAQAQKRLARLHEYPVVADVPYSATGRDYDRELEMIGRAMPALILQTSYSNDALAFMKAYRSRGLKPFAILGMNAGFVSPDFISSLGPDAEGILSREVWAVDLAKKKPLVKTVNDLFRKRYFRDMTGNSARAFTGLMVLADALGRASDFSSETIRKALLETDLRADQTIMPWDGVRFDRETGQNAFGKGIIVQVQRGRYVTVWPEALASNALDWPVSAPQK